MAKKKDVVVEEEVLDEGSAVVEILEEILSAPVEDVIEINGKSYRKVVDNQGSVFLEPLA